MTSPLIGWPRTAPNARDAPALLMPLHVMHLMSGARAESVIGTVAAGCGLWIPAVDAPHWRRASDANRQSRAGSLSPNVSVYGLNWGYLQRERLACRCLCVASFALGPPIPCPPGGAGRGGAALTTNMRINSSSARGAGIYISSGRQRAQRSHCSALGCPRPSRLPAGSGMW